MCVCFVSFCFGNKKIAYSKTKRKPKVVIKKKLKVCGISQTREIFKGLETKESVERSLYL